MSSSANPPAPTPNTASLTNSNIHLQAPGGLSHHFLVDHTSWSIVSIQNAMTRSTHQHFCLTLSNLSHSNPSMAPTIATANSTTSSATTHSKKQASRALTCLSLLPPLLTLRNVVIIKISIGPHWPSSTIHSLGSMTRNVGEHLSWKMITSSRTKSFTQDRHQLQLHISLHASPPHHHSWPESSNHLTMYILHCLLLQSPYGV